MENFKTDLDADGILLCAFDVPGKSMNTFTKGALADLATIAERAKTDATVKGVVLTSGKTTGFCADALPIWKKCFRAPGRPRAAQPTSNPS